jgi:hypothetical protein
VNVLGLIDDGDGDGLAVRRERRTVVIGGAEREVVVKRRVHAGAIRPEQSRLADLSASAIDQRVALARGRGHHLFQSRKRNVLRDFDRAAGELQALRVQWLRQERSVAPEKKKSIAVSD